MDVPSSLVENDVWCILVKAEVNGLNTVGTEEFISMRSKEMLVKAPRYTTGQNFKTREKDCRHELLADRYIWIFFIIDSLLANAKRYMKINRNV